MMQLPILPSNAPADGFGTEPSGLRGILQEHNGNLQQDLRLSSHLLKADPAGLSSENRYAQSRHWPRAGRHHHVSRRRHGPRSEEDISREACRLWRRFQKHDGYAKYRSKQDPKQGDANANGDMVWPVTMEMAFFRALVKYEPMGRKKHAEGPENKLMGRNELIAKHIEEITGEHRSRKQVSSHIQVLKPWVKDDPEIMAYLKQQPSAHTQSRRRDSTSPGTYGSSMYYESSRPDPLASQYPFTQISDSAVKSEHLMAWPGAGLPIRYSLEPVEFDMYMRQDGDCRLHTFTSFTRESDNKFPPLKIDSILDLQASFPQLTQFLQGNSPDCSVVSCNASLKICLDAPPSGAELAISFELRSNRPFDMNDAACCRTYFYNDGFEIEDARRCDKVGFGYNRTRLTKVPFSSKFWAVKITNLSNILRMAHRLELDARKAQKDGDSLREAELRSQAMVKRDMVPEQLQKLSAVQEILVKSPKNATEMDRVLVLHWNFSEASDGNACATWRHLSMSQDIFGMLSPVAKEQPSSQMQLESIPEFDFNSLPQTHEQTPYEGQAFEFYPDPLNGLAGMSADVGASIMPDDMDHVEGLDGDGLGLDFTGGHIDIRMAPNGVADAYAHDGSQQIFDHMHQDPLAHEPPPHEQIEPSMDQHMEHHMEHYSYDGQYLPYDTQYNAENYPTPSLSNGSSYAKDDSVLPSTEFRADAAAGAGVEPGLMC